MTPHPPQAVPLSRLSPRSALSDCHRQSAPLQGKVGGVENYRLCGERMAKKGLYREWLKEENLVLLRGWARNGLFMEQIAKNIGISRKTLNEWVKNYPEIRAALQENKEKADLVVENEVFKRAQGYNVKLVKHMKVRREKFKDGVKYVEEELVPVEEEMHIPADVKAQVFWLTHRKPEIWGRVEEVSDKNKEDTGVIEIPAVVMDLQESEGECENE